MHCQRRDNGGVQHELFVDDPFSLPFLMDCGCGDFKILQVAVSVTFQLPVANIWWTLARPTVGNISCKLQP